MKPIDRILPQLKNVTRNSTGWSACCPAHSDKRPSLSISEAEDGRALLYCHAGCDTASVVEALDLTLFDLMPESPGDRMFRAHETAPPHVASPIASPKPGFPNSEAAVAALEHRHGAKAAMWTYENAEGEAIGLIVRWDTPSGKDIRPVSKAANGWIIAGMPEPRPLYRLPELLAKQADRVCICEGEKAADAAASIGLLATTSPHGARSAGKADWTPLAGRDVVILPDADAAGEQYALDVATILTTLSPPATVRTVKTGADGMGLPDKGDMADWVDRHREGGQDAAGMQVDLERLVAQASSQSAEPVPEDVDAFVPFPTDALPDPVRLFVEEAAKAIGCEPSFLALPLLAALGSAIGNTRCIELKGGWSEPPIIWAVVVGDSGTMKSPALEAALHPIRRKQHEAMRVYTQAMQVYQPRLLQWEKELTVWKRSKAAGNLPEKPEEPMAQRCWCDDVTVEALAMLLLQNRRGLLLVRDELAGWLAGFDRYAQGKGGDVAKWLEMFGGRPLVVDRKSGIPRTIYVPRAAMSVCGGIQPAALSRALGVEYRENGLAARLLLACPPRRQKRWTEADIAPAMEANMARLMDRLYAMQPDGIGEDEQRPRTVRLSVDGKAAWVSFYNEHGQEQMELSGDMSAVWSKLEGYAARLSLVLHCVRWAANDPTLADPDAIDANSIAAGVKLSRWFGNEAKRVYAILNESDDDRNRRRLIELIGRKGGIVTARDLQQSSRMFKKAAEAQEALQSLVAAGLGRWEDQISGAKGGRPTQVFRLHKPATAPT